MDRPLIQSLFHAASGTVGWEFRLDRWGRRGICYGSLGSNCFLCRLVVITLRRVKGRNIQRKGGARYPILVRCPGSEVGHLATFRAKGAPGVTFPNTGLVTEGAGHAGHYTMPTLKIGQGSIRLGRIHGHLQQSI